MGQMGNFYQIPPNLCNFIYHMIHSKNICEMLSVIMGWNWKINVTFSFFKKIFKKNLAIHVQLGTKLINLTSHDLM